MHAAEGILTVRGGNDFPCGCCGKRHGAPHVYPAAVILQWMKKLKYSALAARLIMKEIIFLLTVLPVRFYDGDIATEDATISGNFGRIMNWADSFRVLKVRTNADT